MSWELPSNSPYIPNVRGLGYSSAGGQVPVTYDKPDGTRVHTTTEEYNRSRLEGKPRTRPRPRYDKPTTSSPYARTNVQRPVDPGGTQPHQETSFTEASLERNPGLRQRFPTQTQEAGTSTGRPVDTRINIPETFETSPLLGSASAATGSAGIGGSNILAGGAASVVAGAGLGALLSTVGNRYKDKGAVLPGTDYVGPGNKINIDAPRHASDVIAKGHDIGYEDIIQRARAGQLSEEEFARNIEQLDTEAIEKFAENFRTSGEWQSFVGRWGLYLKNRIEQVTGPLYPSFPGKLWASGRIYLLMLEIIGIDYQKAKDDMQRNNII